MSHVIEPALMGDDGALAPYFREHLAEWDRRPHPFSREEFETLRDDGFFCGRAELVGGQIIAADTGAPVHFTGEQVYRMMDLHLFEEIRFELIDGEIIEMAAQKNFHAIAIANARDLLDAAFGPKFWVRVQATLDMSPHFVPDPDLAVVPSAFRRSPTNPTSALLVVEISDTTLRYDRWRKADLNAAAGITDYWIDNLVDGQLEILRNPQPDAASPTGSRFADVTTLLPGEVAAPLAAPTAKAAVSDLLP
jgi:Uma2 family endonuclease